MWSGLDIYKLSLGIGKSDRGNYVVRGYTPPTHIRSAEDVRAFQASHGLDVDGVWGPRTQKRYELLQAQGAARQAGQYDLEEITRLVVEGLNKLTRAGESAFLPLNSDNAKLGQIMGTQASAQPATLGGVKQEEILQGRPIEKPDKYFSGAKQPKAARRKKCYFATGR